MMWIGWAAEGPRWRVKRWCWCELVKGRNQLGQRIEVAPCTRRPG